VGTENATAGEAKATAREIVRSEFALYADQISALDMIIAEIKSVNRTGKTNRGKERLSRQTLLRVAADFLIEHADELRGDSHAKLLGSLNNLTNQQGMRRENSTARGEASGTNEQHAELLSSGSGDGAIAVSANADGLGSGGLHISIHIDGLDRLRNH
jgi:hypothetical protein